jgi:hypothetical protein
VVSRRLYLGRGCDLPLDAATETIAWVGNKGMGKSTGLLRFGEQMIAKGVQVVTFDPTGVHWGLKYGADKDTAGLPVYVLGGYQGDETLVSTAGALIANLVVESNANFVFDFSAMSKNQMHGFATDFLERLYLRKGEPEHRTPMHILIDEAHLFAPEARFKGTEKMLGAMQDVVIQGRSRGIGISLATQRTAAVSKSVLELCELLVAFRTTGKNARDALRHWIRAHSLEDREREFFDSLATLQVGEVWMWSPGWLDIFQRVNILPRETFDSSATPKAGQRLKPKGKAAEVDLAALKEQMAETIEQATANDPNKLKAEVAQLRAGIERLGNQHEQMAQAIADRDAYIAKCDARIAELMETPLEVEKIVHLVETDEIETTLVTIANATEEALKIARELRDRADTMNLEEAERARHPLMTVSAEPPYRAVPHLPNPSMPTKRGGHQRADAPPPPRATRIPPPPPPPGSGEISVPKAQWAILTVLAMYGEIDLDHLRVCAGYAPGGHFTNTLSAMRTTELITRGNPVTATDLATHATGPDLDDFPPYRGPELREWWAKHKKVGKAGAKILDVLAAVYPNGLSPDELSERAGYSGGHFTNTLSRLRTLGLAHGKGRVPVTIDGWLV